MAELTKNKRFSGVFSVLQRVGKAFMLPIALLPIAGLLLGIGASFTNITTLEAYNLIGIMGPGTFLYSVFTLLASVGTVVFDNLQRMWDNKSVCVGANNKTIVTEKRIAYEQ